MKLFPAARRILKTWLLKLSFVLGPAAYVFMAVFSSVATPMYSSAAYARADTNVVAKNAVVQRPGEESGIAPSNGNSNLAQHAGFEKWLAIFDANGALLDK
ncbi:MAG: hypothetical protein OEQ74_06505, partial [Gammaproteobacteria bacterium]|nr:hypothetical protein [Gammaproteobacteria bacterium]